MVHTPLLKGQEPVVITRGDDEKMESAPALRQRRGALNFGVDLEIYDEAGTGAHAVLERTVDASADVICLHAN